jgi:hypothetical protein
MEVHRRICALFNERRYTSKGEEPEIAGGKESQTECSTKPNPPFKGKRKLHEKKNTIW